MATSTRKAATPRAPRSTLKPTDTPGVFRNRAGVLVDETGVALGFRDIKKADDARAKDVIGKTAELPLDFVESVMRDPRLPRHERMDAAKVAIQYRHPKLNAIQGVAGAPPVAVGFDKASNEELAKLRELAEALLKKQ